MSETTLTDEQVQELRSIIETIRIEESKYGRLLQKHRRAPRMIRTTAREAAKSTLVFFIIFTVVALVLVLVESRGDPVFLAILAMAALGLFGEVFYEASIRQVEQKRIEIPESSRQPIPNYFENNPEQIDILRKYRNAIVNRNDKVSRINAITSILFGCSIVIPVLCLCFMYIAKIAQKSNNCWLRVLRVEKQK